MIDDFFRDAHQPYYRLPNWARLIAGSIYATLPLSIRFGGTFLRFQQLLDKSRNWDNQQVLDYQFLQLKQTVDHAFKRVPYYRRTFREHGLSPIDLKSPEDLRMFPLLTKKDVKDHFSDLISEDSPMRRYLPATTGGSTMEPLRFLHEKNVTRSKEKAFIWDAWSRTGYHPRDRAAHIKGREFGNPKRGIYWGFEPIDRFLELNSNYLTIENLPLYVAAINRYRPKFLIGYTSSVFLLAKFLHSNPSSWKTKLQSVILCSENIYDWQRSLIEEVFQCRVFSHYGHSEMVILASECELSSHLHIYPEYGFPEILNENQIPIFRTGESGELVGTSFDNSVMPLIRYRTQDRAVLGDPTCRCGRNHLLLKKIDGRLQEFLITGDGRLVSICVMGSAHFDVMDHIYQMQYYQETPGEVTVRVVPTPEFSQDDSYNIEHAIAKKMGGDTRVFVETVASMNRSRSGKHKMLVQRSSLEPFGEDPHAIYESGDL